MLRTVFKVAWRDFFRRPAQTVLVVSGLLVSSLVISAALVAADSMEALFLENTYAAWGPVDVRVGTISGNPFPEDVGRRIADDDAIEMLSDGAAPRLSIPATVEAPRTSQREPSIRVIGLDPQLDARIGTFTLIDGTPPDLPAADETIINRRLAKRLDARVGDKLQLFAASPSGVPISFSATVSGIVRDTGKADLGRSANAFFDLAFLQRSVGAETLINQVVVSALGPDREPVRAKQLEGAAAEAAMKVSSKGQGVKVIIADSKAGDIKGSMEQSRFFRAILSMLGAIVALASIALIANLFVMLGEERRSEAGALRAMGLKRRGLILLGVVEGVLYSLAAAVIGSLLGSLFGRYVADLMGDLFDQFSLDSSFEFARPPFEVRPSTLIAAGIGGFIVSMLSVIFISTKTSRLTVIAAIRGLPESKAKARKRIIFPIAQTLVGIPLLFGVEIARLAGSTLIIFGLSSLLAKVLAPRIASTLGALAGLAWGLWANTYLANFEGDPEEAFAIVTLAGVVMVVSSVTLIATNLNAIRRLADLFGPRARSVIKTATAYAAGYRFRTAMSMGMFGLVIYMIAAFAIWGGFGSGTDVAKQQGGFSVLARSTLPVGDMQVKGASKIVGLPSTLYSQGYTVGESQPVYFPAVIYGMDENFSSANEFKFASKPKGLSDRQTWSKLATTKGVAVLDGATDPGSSKVGDKLTLKTDVGEREFEVIGVADEFTLGALMLSNQDFEDLYPGKAGDRTWLVKAGPNTTATQISKQMEKAYAEAGMDARPIKEIFEERAAIQKTFIGIFQLLLKMGLIIGISGLAIGAVRTVLERRQAIGILRAMGFQSLMVGAWLLAETLVVATLGVAVGLGVGLLGTYLLIKEQISNFTFQVDWSQIRSTLLIVYLAVLAFTALPAIRAARLKPAEAVRYVE